MSSLGCGSPEISWAFAQETTTETECLQSKRDNCAVESISARENSIATTQIPR